MRKDEAAFPQSGFGQWQPMPGMTLRDYFAAKAIQGMCADPSTNGAPLNEVAEECYVIANAMLAAREVSK